MTRLATVFAVLCMALFMAQIQAHGAAVKPQTKVMTAGDEVKTDYFTVKLPEGWIMPQPVKKQPNDGVSAVFSPKEGNLAVTINVMRAAMNAKDIAEQTAANMKKTGLRVTDPAEKNGLWEINIEGQAKGKAWFGSNGKVCAVTIVLGKDIAKASEILKCVSGADAALLPKEVN